MAALNRKKQTEKRGRPPIVKSVNKPLEPRERMFVGFYLESLKTNDAALKAGYSKHTAATTASLWVSDPKVKPHVYKAVQEAMKRREHRTEVTQDRVLLELARIGFASGKKIVDKKDSIKSLHDMDDDTAAAISSIEIEEIFAGSGSERRRVGHKKKVRFWNKNDALNTMAKHLGMLMEKMELTGKNGQPLVPNNIELVVNFIKSKAEEKKKEK
jgi:phage terminase small subunit